MPPRIGMEDHLARLSPSEQAMVAERWGLAPLPPSDMASLIFNCGLLTEFLQERYPSPTLGPELETRALAQRVGDDWETVWEVDASLPSPEFARDTLAWFLGHSSTEDLKSCATHLGIGLSLDLHALCKFILSLTSDPNHMHGPLKRLQAAGEFGALAADEDRGFTALIGWPTDPTPPVLLAAVRQTLAVWAQKGESRFRDLVVGVLCTTHAPSRHHIVPRLRAAALALLVHGPDFAQVLERSSLSPHLVGVAFALMGQSPGGVPVLEQRPQANQVQTIRWLISPATPARSHLERLLRLPAGAGGRGIGVLVWTCLMALAGLSSEQAYRPEALASAVREARWPLPGTGANHDEDEMEWAAAWSVILLSLEAAGMCWLVQGAGFKMDITALREALARVQQVVESGTRASQTQTRLSRAGGSLRVWVPDGVPLAWLLPLARTVPARIADNHLMFHLPPDLLSEPAQRECLLDAIQNLLSTPIQ